MGNAITLKSPVVDMYIHMHLRAQSQTSTTGMFTLTDMHFTDTYHIHHIHTCNLCIYLHHIDTQRRTMDTQTVQTYSLNHITTDSHRPQTQVHRYSHIYLWRYTFQRHTHHRHTETHMKRQTTETPMQTHSQMTRHPLYTHTHIYTYIYMLRQMHNQQHRTLNIPKIHIMSKLHKHNHKLLNPQIYKNTHICTMYIYKPVRIIIEKHHRYPPCTQPEHTYAHALILTSTQLHTLCTHIHIHQTTKRMYFLLPQRQ